MSSSPQFLISSLKLLFYIHYLLFTLSLSYADFENLQETTTTVEPEKLDGGCETEFLEFPQLYFLEKGVKIRLEDGVKVFLASQDYLQFVCQAPFPVSIKRSGGLDLFTRTEDVFSVSYSNFTNTSSYTFEHLHGFEYFSYEYERVIMDCVPYLVKPIGGNSSNCYTFTKVQLLKVEKSLQNSGPKRYSHQVKVDRGQTTKGTNAHEYLVLPLTITDRALEMTINDTLCDVVFYYDRHIEIPDNSFNADFSSCQTIKEKYEASGGNTSNTLCFLKSMCDQLLVVKRKEPTVCWRAEEQTMAQKCNDTVCLDTETAKGTRTTQSLVLECPREKTTLEDNFSSKLTTRASIYFPNDPLDREQPFQRMHESWSWVNLRPFDPVRLVNTTLDIQCSAPRKYISDTPFQLVLEFTTGNESRLHFLPPEPYKKYKMDEDIQAAVMQVHFNDTRITRIFCFVHILNTFQWANVSQSVHVLELGEFFRPRGEESTCDEVKAGDEAADRVPSLYLRDGAERLTWDKESNKTPQVLEWRPTFDTLVVICKADEPITLRYLSDNDMDTRLYNQKSLGSYCHERWWYRWDYNFNIFENFRYRRLDRKMLFRCELARNPCIYRQLEISQDKNRNETEIREKDSDIIKTPRPGTLSLKVTQGIDKPLSVPLPHLWHCEAIFYYRKLTKFPGYEISCLFPIRSKGLVNFRYCDRPTNCHLLYENRRLPKECVISLEAGQSCLFCQPKEIRGYGPFVATCTRTSRDGEDFEETHFGVFAFFGVPTTENPVPNIYFNDKHAEENAASMITVDTFDPYQTVWTTLHYVCRFSAYFAAENLTIAYKRNVNGTEELDGDTIALYNDCPKLNENLHLWTMEKNLDLNGQDMNIIGIACLAKGHAGIDIPITSFAPLYVHALEKPKIYIDIEGARVSEATFEADLKNQSISCLAFGYPPPNITWYTPTTVTTSDITTHQINVTYVLSRLTFGNVHSGLEGIYFCRAWNKVGEDSQQIALKVSESQEAKAKRRRQQSLIIVAVLVSILFFVGAILLWRKNKKLRDTLRNLKDEEIRDFIHGNQSTEGSETDVGNEKVYAHISALPYDTSYDISRDQIEIDETEVLGSGQFGIVYKGWICRPEEEKHTVAVKMSKSTVTVDSFKEFLLEVKIMIYIGAHENVAQLLNVCTENIRERQIMAVLEICANGDLLKLLQQKRADFKNIFENPQPVIVDGYSDMTAIHDGLSTTHLLNFTQGIANGMSFLSGKRIIHGDLAARNILVSEDFTAKVSDFGFSRQLTSNALYTRENPVLIPWRWTPLEALRDKKYSIQSDVWSFGVVLFEIFSLGQEPYGEAHSELSVQFLLDLQNGYRMDKPPYANDDIYGLMLDCWKLDPHDRPSFSLLCQKIKDIVEQLPELEFETKSGDGEDDDDSDSYDDDKSGENDSEQSTQV